MLQFFGFIRHLLFDVRNAQQDGLIDYSMNETSSGGTPILPDPGAGGSLSAQRAPSNFLDY